MPFAHRANRIDPLSSAARNAFRVLGITLFAASASLYASASIAADGGKQSDANARYQRERAACNSGASHQDRATCLREAGAALQEARRGRLADEQAAYDQNAMVRCQALPQADRDACHKRIQGAGTSSGSVAEGGIYREYTEIVTLPAPQDSAMPASSTGGTSGEMPQGGSR